MGIDMWEWFDRTWRRVQTWRFYDHVYRVRWVAAGFAILLLVALPWGLRSEERGLESATRAALVEAGISSADVSFSGRTGTVVAAMNKSEQRAARTAVAGVDGVRGITFVLLENPAPSTTMTTQPPPTTTTVIIEPHTHVIAAVSNIGASLAGTIPDARVTADITRVGEFLFGEELTNSLTVDASLPATAWNDAAAEAMSVLPMISRGSITLHERGATIEALVASEEAAEAVTDRLQRILGADVPLNVLIEVSTGDLPELSATITGDTAALSGVLPDPATRIAIRRVVGKAATGDVSDGLTVGSETIATYSIDRSAYLVGRLARAHDATLRISGREIRGSMVNGAVWKKNSPKITNTTGSVLDLLAAMMLGDPSLHLTIEVHSSTASGRTANAALTDERASAVQAALFRAGVAPSRLRVGSGSGSGELLRFLLAPADLDE